MELLPEQTWTLIDSWLSEPVGDRDEVLWKAEEAAFVAQLPGIAVSPLFGKFLHLIARLRGARRILEIGTLGGYSTIWLGRALPADGRIVTLEVNEKHAAIARENLERAGLTSVVEIMTGPAADSLARMRERKIDPFDLIFIDADKRSNDVYFEHAIALSRPGTVIIVDNVVRKGAILEESTEDPDVRGTRRLLMGLRGDRRVTTTVLQTVGLKGHDGFLFAVVN